MERKVLVALLLGMVIGATSAAALHPDTPAERVTTATAPTPAKPVARVAQEPVWSQHHAAIPAEREPREAAPTF